MELRIAGITKESVVDGPGLRMVIFTQGCPHRCEGCHNPQTHDPLGGTSTTTDEMIKMINEAKLIRGITFSGGEPFIQAKPLCEIARAARARGLNIVTYTGFVFEELLAMGLRVPTVRELLRLTDILVDGPYRAAERDLNLAFRGSRNQRLIDVPKSLRLGRTVLWENPEQKLWA
ncbi:anaerobic ribonucleoside-triphosphate reductase activating protein [Sporolituus thermophilus]|uniref:Anaerobic ribonucleoside-triphosphate reductase-activating protein n=1 Tax=Sporolituus thermophilus DSM 23256 TaxID=1123285 RepID=A0A1G7I300_9FIRM|nr:anaerobic ribonucleoside-triphosphate reductase activating protein [Sporolituus thermophilus]SDF06836.1 anaerobic ribonucleoside-triphosphate reductase activating protein [Sporolituus thermophilus DSM 23256]